MTEIREGWNEFKHRWPLLMVIFIACAILAWLAHNVMTRCIP